MIAQTSGADLRPIVALAVAGLAFGWGYFAALRHTVALYAARGAAARGLLWTVARVVAAALFFAFAVRRGAGPLAAAFVGFLAARQLAVRAARRPA